MSPAARILIVEDDPAIVEVVSLHLRDQGFHVHVESEGESAMHRIERGDHDLVILDLMLPGMDGLTICRRIRENDPYLPILILSAKSDEVDRIVGLELGADDYITKPFSVRELVARIRAMLRRTRDRSVKGDRGATQRRIGNLVVDTGQRVVLAGSHRIELTAKEFDLLVTLCDEPGRAFSRRELLELVWGYHYAGYSHTVNSHINRLRAKIEPDPGHPRYIETVWGFGYRFAPETASTEDAR